MKRNRGTDVGKEMPLLEKDEALIDTEYIHWGYLNSCQIVSKGRKVKKEEWNTYWVELCGSTLRFYRDSSLHIESNLFPPPSYPNCMLEENEIKIAFVELKNADIEVLSNEAFSGTLRRQTKKSVTPKVFRRHLFQLKLRHLRSTYVFQAPSHSAMLRWVSKLQESLDTTEHDKKSSLPEQRLKLARDMMKRKSKTLSQLSVEETDVDTISMLSDVTDVHDVNPTLRNLKNQLAIKQEQIWMFERQIIDFLGSGRGEFKREEFMCTTKQDYSLIPGRMETFIPAGTIVTIFGQLPNRRWRCLIEMNELKKVMTVLVDDLKNGIQADDETRSISPKVEGGISAKRDMKTLENLLNNLPEYPILGCLPSSVLDMDSKKSNVTFYEKIIVTHKSSYTVTVESTPYVPPQRSISTQIDSAGKCKIEHQHGTLHDDISNNIEVSCGHIDALTNNDQDNMDDETDSDNINVGELKVTDLDVESESTSEDEDDVPPINDNVRLRSFGAGFIIQKKLRQKGISIIVGSSSSEGEEESDDNEDN